jgi:hypothetical protein
LLITFVNLSADIVSSATSADQPVIPSASTSQRQEIALKQVTPSLSLLLLVLDHKITYSVSFFRNKIPLTAYFPLPSRSLKMKVRKQVLLGQSESHHRQRSEQSWRICQPFFIKTQRNWSMTMIRPKLCSGLSEVKSLSMPRKFFFRLHT